MVKEKAHVKTHMKAFRLSSVSIPEWLVFVLLVGSYLRGLWIPLMDNDSAHHALIALRMIESGNYHELIFRDADYLDKPHFLFWAVALSFKIFGVSAWAYKLPSLLFSVAGIYATYRLGKRVFNAQTGQLAAVILASSYAFFLANNDVRMDAILTASIIFATWQLVEWIHTNRLGNMFMASIGLAVGFATKGAIGLVMPALAGLLYMYQINRWSIWDRMRWAGLVSTTALLLLPVFYSMYLQFDLHPEKVIRNSTGNSGVLFLLFGQSVGRYSGTGWGTLAQNEPFFFVHTFLWAFLPWSLVALLALTETVKDLAKSGRALWRRDTVKPASFFLVATSTIIFLLISGSQFKLPHYLNILFPFFALLTSSFLTTHAASRIRLIRVLQYITLAALLVVTCFLNAYVFPVEGLGEKIMIVVLMITLAVCIYQRRDQIVLVTLLVTSFCYAVLNFNFYPKALALQGGSQLARFVTEQNISVDNVFYLQGYGQANSLDFAVGKIIPSKPIDRIDKPAFIVTDEPGKHALQDAGLRFAELKTVPDFRVSVLSKDWIIPKNRNAFQGKLYLLFRER
jgi:4-amino-4-deoxy-L-arabinose transferase-like glycosyltransferase